MPGDEPFAPCRHCRVAGVSSELSSTSGLSRFSERGRGSALSVSGVAPCPILRDTLEFEGLDPS
jgi:hypothetical protein